LEEALPGESMQVRTLADDRETTKSQRFQLSKELQNGG